MKKRISLAVLFFMFFINTLYSAIFRFEYQLLDNYSKVKLVIKNIKSETVGTIVSYDVSKKYIEWDSTFHSTGKYFYEVYVFKAGMSDWGYKKVGYFWLIK